MTQQVTVTSDTAEDMRPLIEAAIQRQLRLIVLGIARTKSHIAELEACVGMTTQDYERRLSSGEVDESLDLLDLEGEMRTLSVLQAQETALREARVS